MGKHNSAGVYIEELSSGTPIVESVSTSNMGIVGAAQRGPVDKATLITSLEQYDKTFGGLMKTSLMGHTVTAFFANGGKRAFVVRVVPSDATTATATLSGWTLTAASKGIWGNDLRVDIAGSIGQFNAPTATYSYFDVKVSLKNKYGQYETVETFDEVSFDAASDVYFPEVLNELSDYVQVSGSGTLPAALNSTAGAPLTVVPDGSLIITGTHATAAARRSVVITWTDEEDIVHTITDDGAGKLVGDVATGTNTISYAAGGAITAKLSVEPKTLTDVVVTWKIPATATKVSGDFATGSNGAAALTRMEYTDYATLSPAKRGLYALDRIEEIMQVCVPDFAGDAQVTKDLLDYAALRAEQASGGDRFIILTTPKGKTAQEAVEWFRYTLAAYSKFAALYWPWVKVADPLSNGRTLVMPPLGHIAGVYARTDATKNVGKAPGGTVDGALRWIKGLETDPQIGDRDYVYQNKINPLISSVQTGTAVWGVRTIAQESEWRYINVRRLFMFLEKSVFNATHWVVFENNGPTLWTRLKTQLGGFMHSLFVEGYFAGQSPKDAYYVIVDSSNNLAGSIEAGEVIVDVGASGNKPAEFARFRFAQKTVGA